MIQEIQVLDKGFVRLIDVMGDDKRIVNSARISYNGESKGDEADKKLLFYLYKNLHMSPFEMAKITMHVKMPIFVMRQFVRHRMQNLNEISFRYTEPKDDFYIPTVWRKQAVKNKQGSEIDENWWPRFKREIPETILEEIRCTNQDPNIQTVTIAGHENVSEEIEKICNELYKVYESLVKSGVAREMARMILPVNLYTEIYTTFDLRNLLHFISLRSDPHAQLEIREYSKAFEKIVAERFPWTWEAFCKYKIKLVEQELPINQ